MDRAQSFQIEVTFADRVIALADRAVAQDGHEIYGRIVLERIIQDALKEAGIEVTAIDLVAEP